MNVKNITDCYGCGICATVCAKKIIEITFNKNGFYEPKITDFDKCTNCGLCKEVCAFSHKELALCKDKTTIKGWAAWSDDEIVRHRCSSGGIGFEIARQLIGKEYKLCGCRYNAEKKRAEHYIATTPEEAISTIGSKYIQSYTVDGFKAINRNEKYLVTGTPCQIDSFRRYIKRFRVEDNFVLLDFYCHCAPSMLAWEKYLKMVEKQTGRINNASWRNKSATWHDSLSSSLGTEPYKGEKVNWHDSYNILIKGETDCYNSRRSQGDVFYNLFLGDFCCNPACVKKCKYKYDSSSADIRIGDLWGSTYKDNEKGVSALITFTSKGREIVEQLHDVTLIEHPFEVVTEGQMQKNVKQKEMTFAVRWFLRTDLSITNPLLQAVFFIQKVINKIKEII